jgi:excisionase family DNA binding protein
MSSEKLTTKEVAKRERITPRTVRNLCERGELPAYKVGGQWRIEPDYKKHLRDSKKDA